MNTKFIKNGKLQQSIDIPLTSPQTRFISIITEAKKDINELIVFSYDQRKSCITLQLKPTIKAFLEKMDPISIKDIYIKPDSYAERLLTLVISKGFRSFSISLDSLKESLKVTPGKYKELQNFHQRVLVPSINLLNQMGIPISYSTLRPDGKTVTRIHFDLTAPKPQPDPMDSLRALLDSGELKKMLERGTS